MRWQVGACDQRARRFQSLDEEAPKLWLGTGAKATVELTTEIADGWPTTGPVGGRDRGSSPPVPGLTASIQLIRPGACSAVPRVNATRFPHAQNELLATRYRFGTQRVPVSLLVTHFAVGSSVKHCVH